MKSRTFACITAMILFATLALPVGLGAQEKPTENATTGTENPVPLISQPLVPDAIRPGGAGFMLIINGTGFVPGSVVQWNSSTRATTFVNRSQLKASILAADIVNPTTARVTVVNSTGGTSNVVFFEVTTPTSSISLGMSEFGADTEPYSVATADFDSDGELDLAVANVSSNNVSVLLGNGDGTFRTAVNYPTGSGARSVVVGDFNGDGKVDLAVANLNSNDVSVLLGNGDGTFKAPMNFGVGLAPVSLAVGDFDGDGKLDLAVANAESNNVSVLLGNGDGTFRSAVDYSGGSEPFSVAVGDFNRDDKLDLVVANVSSNNVSVLLGNGDGTFRPPMNSNVEAGPGSLAVGDFNSDGKLDLAVQLVNGTVSVLLGNGNGTFQKAVNYFVGETDFGFESVTVGDFNGDGKVDLAVTQSSGNNGGLSVLLGNGDGTFQRPVTYLVGESSVDQLIAGDFNGDGRLDLAVADSGAAKGVFVLLQGTLGLSKTGLEFADQVVETSSAMQTVKLTNIGPLALSLSSIAVTGGDFIQTNTCDSSLSVRASCVISVTFKPTKIGPRRALVTITDSTPGSPQSVTLSGTGVTTGMNATLSQTTVTFPVELVGTTSKGVPVTLSNYGTAALNIASIGVSGNFTQTNTCGSSIAAGASCTIYVAFKPSQGETLAGTLSVSDNAPGSPQTVSLRGTGTIVKLSPTQLSFECYPIPFPQYHCVCPFPQQTTTLTNVGNMPLNITGIAISGPFSQTHTCGTSVAPGNSCGITVTWSRTRGSGEISLIDNGGASPQTVPLTGRLFCSP